jgi:hypothetical protein
MLLFAAGTAMLQFVLSTLAFRCLSCKSQELLTSEQLLYLVAFHHQPQLEPELQVVVRIPVLRSFFRAQMTKLRICHLSSNKTRVTWNPMNAGDLTVRKYPPPRNRNNASLILVDSRFKFSLKQFWPLQV